MFRNILLTNHFTHMQAAIYALIAFFLYSASDAMAKWLMADGFDRAFILIINSIPSTIILTYIMVKRNGWRLAYHTNFKKLHFIRGLSLIGITYFGLQAIFMLPLTDFYGIIFSTPFVTTIGAFFLFKEKITVTEAMCILIGFCGVLVVAQPDYDHFNMGYLYAFGAVFCVSAAGLTVRKIGREENPFLYIIFGNLAIIAVNIIPSFMHDIPTITITHIIIFAIYSTTIPLAVLIMSANFARAPSVACIVPFQYTQIIWGAIFGFIIFHDVPQLNTIIGSGIVMACGLYIILYHKRKRSRELRSTY